MVAVDLIISFCFYIFAALGMIGLAIGNAALIAVSLSVLGLLCVVLAVASFTVYSIILRILNLSLICAALITSLLVGLLSGNIDIWLCLYFGMLAAWTASIIILGIVDCYDTPETIFNTVTNKLLGAVFVCLAAAGMMNGSDTLTIIAICGFGVLSVITFIAAIIGDYSAMKGLFYSILLSLVLTVAASLVLIFMAGMVWWHLFALVVGGIYFSCYIGVTIISGETDGVTERVCDIKELFGG